VSWWKLQEVERGNWACVWSQYAYLTPLLRKGCGVSPSRAFFQGFFSAMGVTNLMQTPDVRFIAIWHGKPLINHESPKKIVKNKF
jgi:hypothetical protein